MSDTLPKPRGGKRAGAGRKRKGEKPRCNILSLPVETDLKDWYASLDSSRREMVRSELRAALRKAYIESLIV